MSEPFNFNQLSGAYGQLKADGIRLQQNGAELVRIADAGMANIAPAQALVTRFESMRGTNPQVGSVLLRLNESGNYALKMTNEIHENVSAINTAYAYQLSKAVVAVTHSNIGTSAATESLLIMSPVDGREYLDECLGTGLVQAFKPEELDQMLAELNPELPRRRRGAWETFHAGSADAFAQASHSMREVLNNGIIAKHATNSHIEACTWYQNRKAKDPLTKPKLKDRIRYLLYGNLNCDEDDPDLTVLLGWVESYEKQDANLKSIAHGSLSYTERETRLGMQTIEELLYYILTRMKALS